MSLSPTPAISASWLRSERASSIDAERRIGFVNVAPRRGAVAWHQHAASRPAAAVAAALAGRYAADRDRAAMQTIKELYTRLTDLGEDERLSILPLVERHTLDQALRGEPGLSYLIRADGTPLLPQPTSPCPATKALARLACVPRG